MNAAIDFIESHLEEPLDMAEVARRAASSPFHFQRMFHMLTGVTVAEYVRKRRLTLAAQDLVASSARVIDVALRAGYESPEAFAKAFRRTHGVSPSDARLEGATLKAFARLSFQLSLKGASDVDYRIVNREGFRVSGPGIRVSTRDGENFRRIPRFWENAYRDGTVARLRGLRPDGVLIAVCTDMDHRSEECTYGIAVEGVEPLEPGWTAWDIPAATWAVFTSTGALPAAVHEVWRRIFEEWFPATGYQHTGGPELEVIPPGNDLADDYRCEVWIPVMKS